MHAVPESDKPSKGTAITKISPLSERNLLAAIFALPTKQAGKKTLPGFADWFVFTVTQNGMVKKSTISDLPGASADLFTLVKVNDGDRLGWIRISNGQNQVMLITAKGIAIRFNEETVRPMGLVAAGVMGMKLAKGDEVVGMELLPQAGDVFLMASDGSVKRVAAKHFPTQGRYGQGVVAWKLPAKTQVVGLCIGKATKRGTLHMRKLLPKTFRFDEAPLQGRTARGRVIQELKPGDRVLTITVPWEVPRPVGKGK
jgi:DNA gyrase subunit A